MACRVTGKLCIHETHPIGGGGGGTTIYERYRYVPLRKVWFSSSLLWDRVYKSESLGLEEGIIFHLD